MAIQNMAEDIICVALPKTPHLSYELKPVNEMISSGTIYDVIIDFLLVEEITSASISNLLILQDLLSKHGRQLLLCNVSLPTKCIFAVIGLEKHFRFVSDKFAALEVLQCSKSVPRELLDTGAAKKSVD
jgi:anti-anti-sigma regulatory factor